MESSYTLPLERVEWRNKEKEHKETKHTNKSIWVIIFLIIIFSLLFYF